METLINGGLLIVIQDTGISRLCITDNLRDTAAKALITSKLANWIVLVCTIYIWYENQEAVLSRLESIFGQTINMNYRS